MSNEAKIFKYNTLSDVAVRFRSDLNDFNYVLVYAYNGTGKTRLSMEFKNRGRDTEANTRDTLYFNAFTEDLFYWDNDLENDTERVLKINADSNFFNGFKELALEEKIFGYLQRYAEFDFKIDYEEWHISFSKGEEDKIKISRGEENIFIWCVFLAICELVIDGAEAYSWVKYIYIDDPVSSLDDNNVIAIANDLGNLLKKDSGKRKIVISSHHHLFFNVMYNDLKRNGRKSYFFHKNGANGYTLRATDETPFFHHVATLCELKRLLPKEGQTIDDVQINTYHFNMLRSVVEKTAVFFGYSHFSKCIHGIEDEVLFGRALDLLSHGKYSIYEPVFMGKDTKQLFVRILDAFLRKYEFYLPEILIETEQENR